MAKATRKKKKKPKSAKGSHTQLKKAQKRSPKAKKSAKRKKASPKAKRAKGAGTSSRGRVTLASVKSTAFEHGCIVAGAAALGIADIGRHFKKHPRHKAAWERGLFLGNLRDLAAAPTEKAEAAHALGMDIGAFEKLLAEDLEAVAVWNQAHIDTVVEMKLEFRKQAAAGKKHAMDRMLRVMRGDLVRPDVDFNRVSLADVVVVCRITRQTVCTWVSKFKAPQNADGTYSLPALWGWYEDFILLKVEGGKVKVPAEVSDPLRAETARMRRVQVEEALGRLLPRDEVVAGILARHQQFLNAVNGKPEEMAIALAGQPSDVVVKALTEFFDGIKGDLCYVPDELRLDEGAKVLMLDLMKAIGATNNGLLTG